MLSIAALLFLLHAPQESTDSRGSADSQQSSAPQLLHKAGPGETIAFVHIESETPQLTLGVYSSEAKIDSWPGGSVGQEQVSIAANEHYFLDKSRRLLSIGAYKYLCMGGASRLGLAELTQLHFPGDFPRPKLEDVPPIPKPDPPPPVAGACSVHLSDDGSVILFAASHLERGQPSAITIFSRDRDRPDRYRQTAEFPLPTQSEVSMADGGRLIALRSDKHVIVIDAKGHETARRPLAQSFMLSASGAWLVNWSSTEARFSSLNADGGSGGQEVVFPTATPCIDVRIYGNVALVRERAMVSLLDIEHERVVWSRSIEQGNYCSMDLVLETSGRTLVALGRRHPVRPHARRGAGLENGKALGTAEVWDTQVQDPGVAVPEASVEMELPRWTYDTPRVEFAGDPAQLVVTTPDQALLVDPNL